MSEVLITAAAAGTGAALQEVLWWYQLRHRLARPEIRALVGSPAYWAVVTGFVAIAALTSLFWFGVELGDATQDVASKDALVFGISLPLVIKQFSRATSQQLKFGGGGKVDAYLNS